MKRKVLRVGRSSYAVSLPMEFIETNKIKTSQEIEVEHHGATILIRCETPRSTLKKIDISELTVHEHEEKVMDKILGALFKQGSDHFSLICEDKRKADIIRELLRKGKLSMYEEPTAGNPSAVTIHCSITHFDENALENMSNVIIKQIYRNFDEFISSIKNRSIKKDQLKGILSELASRDKMIGEEADICRRIINKNVINYKSTTVYNFVDKLEKIGDCVRDLILYSIDNPEKAKKHNPIMTDTRELLNILYYANTGFSIKKINTFYERCFEIEKKIAKCDDKIIYHCLKSMLTIIKSAHSNLLIINI